MNPNPIAIRERIRQAVTENTVQAQAILTTPVEKKSFMTTFLGVCILLLSVATVWAMVRKNVDKIIPANTIAQTTTVSELPQGKPELTSQKLDDLTKKMEIWANRTWLLGVVHNENMNLTRQMQQAQGIKDPGYVVLDDNWKLNRVPSTMQMTEEQKQKLVRDSK
jgi:hypothetical protein